MSADNIHFGPGNKHDDLVTRHDVPGGVSPCFHVGDDGDEPMAHYLGIGGGGGTCCFQPGDEDDELMARQVGPGGGGQLCFHPGDEGGASMTHLADDLAVDLHLALTGIDDRQLAMLT